MLSLHLGLLSAVSRNALYSAVPIPVHILRMEIACTEYVLVCPLAGCVCICFCSLVE